MEPDEDLIERLKAGDERAAEDLISMHGPRVWNTLRGLVRGREEAEDLFQETFLSVTRSIGRFKGDSKLSTWIYRIAVNAARMRRRDRARKKRVPEHSLVPIDPDGHMAHIPDWSMSPEKSLLRHELAERLIAAINDLPFHSRTVYSLAEIEGLSYDEIGRILGIRPGTAKVRLHRARLHLRKALADYMEGSGEE